MKIELRNISYNARLSEETSAFAGKLFVDGLHVANISNHGTGGPDEVHPVNGKTWADIEKIEAWITANHPKQSFVANGETHEFDPSLESVCGALLDEHLISRDLQRTLKRTIAYFDPDRNGIFTLKGKIEGVQRAHIITDLARRKPNAMVLNNLPFAGALALYRQYADKVA